MITMQPTSNQRILVCDTQPLAVEGIRWLLNDAPGLEFLGGVTSLEAAFELVSGMTPAAVILDKALGVSELVEWLQKLGASGHTTAPIVWGSGITESDALRLLQAGARGILGRSAEPATLIQCLHCVIAGTSYMEDGIFGTSDKFGPRRSGLTARESEVAALVEQGMKNRDVAKLLGIQTGTVKIHLKHIFEKTGVRGRYGLVLTGLRKKGAIPFAAMPSLPTM